MFRALCFLGLLLLASCTSESNSKSSTLSIVLDGVEHMVQLDQNGLSTWKDGTQHSHFDLPYPTYRFAKGDVTGDGFPEILVGVEKATRFHPVVAKRLFVFKLVDGRIRPLWLGSRMAQPLEDFAVATGTTGAVIRTLETEQDGSYLVADYEWTGFGFVVNQYLARNISLSEAQILLNDEKNALAYGQSAARDGMQ